MARLPNINSILSFVTVARMGSVSAAADHLCLTQPAVSHQLRRLSEETGLQLFERTATGLALTTDGRGLLPKAQAVLGAAEALTLTARHRAEEVTGHLRIGTIVDPEFIRLGALLRAMRQQYPMVECNLSQAISGEILAQLKRGQLDAGFFLAPPEDAQRGSNDMDKLEVTDLSALSYRVIGPAGWQSQLEQKDWTEIAQLPWIGTPEASVHHQLLKHALSHASVNLNVVAQVDQESSMLEMVRAGIGLSLCRDAIALRHNLSEGLALAPDLALPARLCFAVQRLHTKKQEFIALHTVLTECWAATT